MGRPFFLCCFFFEFEGYGRTLSSTRAPSAVEGHGWSQGPRHFSPPRLLTEIAAVVAEGVLLFGESDALHEGHHQ